MVSFEGAAFYTVTVDHPDGAWVGVVQGAKLDVVGAVLHITEARCGQTVLGESDDEALPVQWGRRLGPAVIAKPWAVAQTVKPEWWDRTEGEAKLVATEWAFKKATERCEKMDREYIRMDAQLGEAMSELREWQSAKRRLASPGVPFRECRECRRWWRLWLW